MAERPSGRWARLVGGWLSPRGWLWRAAALLAAFALFHLLGWRQYTAILCGTLPEGSPPGGAADWRVLAGLLYALSYFAAVVVAPILVLGAGIFAGLLRVGRAR